MIEAITGSTRFLSRSLSLFVASRALVPREGDGGKPTPKGELTEDQVRRIIAEEGRGDSKRAIRVIARDRQRASDRARTAETKLDELEKAGRIAPEKGFVILTGDEAKAWPDVAKYVSDGKLTVPKLLELAKKVPELEGQVAAQSLATRRADAAKALHWNQKNLAEVLETKSLEIEERDVLVEDEENKGKRVKRSTWCVRKKGGKDEEWEPLGNFAETNLQIFLPALQDVDEGTEEGERRAPEQRRRQGAPNGTQWPEQSRSRTPSKNGNGPEDEAKARERAIASNIYAPL